MQKPIILFETHFRHNNIIFHSNVSCKAGSTETDGCIVLSDSGTEEIALKRSCDPSKVPVDDSTVMSECLCDTRHLSRHWGGLKERKPVSLPTMTLRGHAVSSASLP